jgi:alkanesulfonate monooxygenase SsuD/methylene tetrahydromethanopterin reductase-like flavin-dependent oxidoreductase (luciferase family)
MAWEAHSLSVLTEGRFEMGIGTGRPGIEDELRELSLPVVTPGQRLSQVRDTITSLRELDGPDLHTPVVMAVRGPGGPGASGRPGGYGHVRRDAG